MANSEHLEILRQGVVVWNEWREKNRAIQPDLRRANLREADLSGVNLIKANLSLGNLIKSNLIGANLREADLSGANLIRANLNGANLIRANLNGANLPESKLIEADLSFANLIQANLREANLSLANLIQASLSLANLSETKLIATQALYTNFEGAPLTGACIRDWNINRYTNFENVICKYIYLSSEYQNSQTVFTDRRPSDPNKIFAPGDFARLVQKSLATVDIIFREGIDWSAFFNSFQGLQVEGDDRKLSIQAIEKKGDGSFVVRVEVPENADKGEIERSFRDRYNAEVKLLEAVYREKLQAKEREIAIYKEKSADIMELAKLAASRPIHNINNAEAKAMTEKEQKFYAPVGSVDNHGTQTNIAGVNQGMQMNAVQQQNLVAAIQEIQSIVETFNPSTTVEQMTAATEAIQKIESNPTLKPRAINAAKNGLMEGLKQNPVGAIVAGIIEGWMKEE